MIVVHRSERTPNHGVLKVGRPIHGRDLARELLPNAKVLGAPCNALSRAEQSARNSGNRHGHFSRMDVPGKMDLHTSREIEASFDRRTDHRKFFQSHHERSLPCSASIRT